MIQLTAAQVEWLANNEPETQHHIREPEEYNSEYQTWNGFTQTDIQLSANKFFLYYLTFDVYNSLPQTFKDLC
jgi:hypothetical protein